MSARDELIEILHREATTDRVKATNLRKIPIVRSKLEASADAILAVGFRKFDPDSICTEWGVESPWGSDSSPDYETAHVTVRNMRNAGHKASIIWRGITQWRAE